MGRRVAPWKTVLTIGVALMVVVVSGRGRVFGEGGTWTVKAPIPTPRYELAVGVVNGILYAVGGTDVASTPASYLSTVEAYNPTTDKWTAKAPMPTPRAGLGVGVVNGILYAVGGSCCSSLGGKVLNSVVAYDPTTDKWTAKAPMLTPRAALAVGVVNGILYAVGGAGDYPDTPFLSAVEAYNPTTNTWTTKAPMSTERSSVAVGVVNGILYAVGGAGCCNLGHNTGLRTVEAYNPATNKWTVKAPMPTQRLKHAVGVANQVLYAMGGSGTGPGLVSAVETYDPTTNTWTTKAPMPSARFLHAVGVANGILYVVGGVGASKGGAPPNDWIVQYPRDLLVFKP